MSAPRTTDGPRTEDQGRPKDQGPGTVDPAIRLLRQLVSINSVNPTLVPGAPGEADVADAIEAWMRAMGLAVTTTVVRPGRPNVVGVLDSGRSGPSLMFCGHIDTVGVAGMTDPFVPREADGRLYGRGAQDMKSGVAAMIDAARVIAEGGGLPAGRLIIACVVDEEHLSIGAEALVKEWKADGGVVTEPTDLTIATGHKGFAWAEVEVFGKAAHGSRPKEGEDAILRLGRVLGRLEALDRELQARTPHPSLGTGSVHASFISGGRELSSYPDRATLQLERRLLPGEPETAAVDEVRAILHRLAGEDRSFRAQATAMFSRPAYEVPANHVVARTLADAVRDGGGAPTFGGASFWTDAAVLGYAGIPSVLYGPGGAGLHSTEEYVTLADVITCRDTLVSMARLFCNERARG